MATSETPSLIWQPPSATFSLLPQVRSVTRDDFDAALCQVRPSVSPTELEAFEEWNKAFGSFANADAKRLAAEQAAKGRDA